MLWTRRLAEAIARSPIGQNEGCAYLHLVARPVVPEEDMLDRAMGDQDVATFLNGLFSTALSEDVWPRTSGGKGYSPDLADNNSFKRRADGWVTAQGLGADWRDFEEPRLVLDFEISPDGSGRLFCGRAAEGCKAMSFGCSRTSWPASRRGSCRCWAVYTLLGLTWVRLILGWRSRG